MGYILYPIELSSFDGYRKNMMVSGYIATYLDKDNLTYHRNGRTETALSFLFSQDIYVQSKIMIAVRTNFYIKHTG